MVVFMLVFILPKITESFKKTGVEVPGLTQFMINMSDFIIGNYILIIGGIVASAIGFILLKRTYI